MPGFFPGRPGGKHDEPLLDMILERRPIPPGAPPEIHGLAHMLAAAAGSAEPGELTGEAAALAAFTRLGAPAGVSPAGPRSARRSVPRRRARGRLPLAAALTAVAAGLGSTAASYAGVLPSPIQHFAHEIMGAPAPHHDVPGHAPAVASSPTHAPRQPSGSAPPGSHEAASSVPPGGSDWPRNGIPGFPGNPAGNNLATCPSSAGGAQNKNGGQKDKNQGQSQSRPSPSPTPAPVTRSPGPGQGQGQGPGQGQAQSQSTASPSLNRPCGHR